MTRVVESIAPDYEETLFWEKVITKEKKGALRFIDLSKSPGQTGSGAFHLDRRKPGF